MKRFLALFFAGTVVSACAGASLGSPTASIGGPSPSESPYAGLEGPDGLLLDLRQAGASVSPDGSFATDPFPGLGVLYCVNGQPVRVYAYSTVAERVRVSARIDPNDPSNLGTAIVDWAGSPRFWQRDRILVLYLGSDPAAEALLTSVLGQPFARGLGLPLPQPETCS